MSEQRQFEPRKKHFMDDFLLRLTAEPLQGCKKSPTLHLTVVNNNPVIEVYTQKPDDKNRGMISARMGTVTAHLFLERFYALLEEAPKSQYIIKNKRRGSEGEPIHDSTTVIGKDDEGKVYISVLSSDPDRPKIRFYYSVDKYHELAAGNGRKLTPGESSVAVARAWCNMVKGLLPVVQVANYVEYQPKNKDQNQRQGGGGYQKKPWQGGGGGGNWKDRQQNQHASKPAAEEPAGNFDFDDDIPL